MLVLRRNLDEAILIGDDIRVVVAELHAGCVVLGVEAPHNVSIVREELATRTATRPGPVDDKQTETAKT